MSANSQSDGSGGLKIHIDEMGGWVRVFPSRYDDLPRDLHVALSNALAEWFRQRPQLRLRVVTTIAKQGDSVEMHAWYDVVLFAAPQRPTAEVT